MSASDGRRFASRPGDLEGWIKAAEVQPDGKSGDSSFTARLTVDLAPQLRRRLKTEALQRGATVDGAFTARLTVDITPELRGRIKVVAFQRGVTVADMLRDLLAREFPSTAGDQP